jgi:hypothetical protein
MKKLNEILDMCPNFYDRESFANGYLKGYEQAEKELIDKAVEWIGEIYDYCEIMRYSDSYEPPLSELTEWFKNYMKEENINSK